MELQKKKSVKKKIVKHLEKGTFGRYMMMLNPWLRQVLDPFNHFGAKVPDEITQASAAFHVTQRFNITADSTGQCGVALGAYPLGAGPYKFAGSMVPIGVTDTGIPSFAYGAILTQTSGVITGTTPLIYDQWSSTATTIQNTFSNVRPVAQALRVTYTGQLLNAQGKLTCWSNPRNTIGNNNDVANSGLSVGFLMKLQNSGVYSIPKYGGASIVYFPQDPISRQYGPTKISEVYASEGITKYLGGELGVWVDGAVANQTFLVEVITHFEGFPYLNTFSIASPTLSKSDPLALAHGMNTMSQIKPVAPIPDKEASKLEPVATAMKIHKESPEPGIMDSLLSGMGNFGKVVDEGINLGKKFAPMISSALSLL